MSPLYRREAPMSEVLDFFYDLVPFIAVAIALTIAVIVCGPVA